MLLVFQRGVRWAFRHSCMRARRAQAFYKASEVQMRWSPTGEWLRGCEASSSPLGLLTVPRCLENAYNFQSGEAMLGKVLVMRMALGVPESVSLPSSPELSKRSGLQNARVRVY
eukprot:6196192-Pleurochrysis_carterae.AAC.2